VSDLAAASGGAAHPRRRVALALALVGAALAAGLATPWFLDFDEAVYAEAARGMLTSGDWVRPQWNGRPFYEKPALFYWLTASLYALLGVTPAAPRLVSLAATLATLAMAAAEARRRWGEAAAEVAVWAGGAALLPFSLGRLGLLDALLVAATTAALLALRRGLESPPGRERRRWLAAGYAAAGAALAVKGPAFPLLIGAVLLADAARRRRMMATLRASGVAWGAPLLLLVGVPWYVLAWRVDGPLVLAQFVGKHTLGRLAEPLQGHGGPLWYYLPVLAVGLMPFTALLPGAVAALWRERRAHAPGHDAAVSAAVWAAVPLAAFSLAATKLPQYIAPAAPALALLVAWAATASPAPWRRLSWHATLAGGALAAGLVAAVPVVLARATALLGEDVLRDAPGLVCLGAARWRWVLLPAAAALFAGAAAARRRGLRGDTLAAVRALGVAGAVGWCGVWAGLGHVAQVTTIAPLVALAERAAAELPAGTAIHLVRLNHRVTPTIATGRPVVYLDPRNGDDMERLRGALAAAAPARAVVPAAWWEEIRGTVGGRALARDCGLVLVGETPQ
jgi:4-amino-4-deoxy-L-arabinose transferase-like glycosyltransferase